MLEDSLSGGNKHPLYTLPKDCLNDDPFSRPTAENLVTTLQEIKATIMCPYGITVARVDAVREVLMVRALREGCAELDATSSELMMKLEEMQAAMEKDKENLGQMEIEVQQQKVQLQKLITEADNKRLLAQNTDLQAKLMLKFNAQVQQELQQRASEFRKKIEHDGQFQISPKRVHECNVLLLGKTGSGKSTLGNKLLNHSNTPQHDPFYVSHSLQNFSAEAEMRIEFLHSVGDFTLKLKVVDTVCTFDDRKKSEMFMENLSLFIEKAVPNGFHIVLFVSKMGHWTVEEIDIFKFITGQFSEELSSTSALIMTGCENMTDEAKSNYVAEFVKAYPSVAEFMKKGIHTVGFPDIERMKPAVQSMLQEDIRSDQEYLRQLLYYSYDENKLVKVEMKQTAYLDNRTECTLS